MPKLLADPVASEEIKQDELRFLGNL